MSFASTDFDRLAKPTRRAKFLEDMDRILPWQQLCEIVRPVIRQAKAVGRRSIWSECFSASVYALRIDRLPMQPHSDEPLISIPSDGSDRLIDQLRDLWNDGSDGRVGRAKVELQHGVRRGRVLTHDYSINLESRGALPRFRNGQATGKTAGIPALAGS